MNRAREIERCLVAEIEAHGVTEYRIENGGKHKRLVFTFNGVGRFKVFSRSPSDRRTMEKALRDVRRLMGVGRIVVKSRRPAKSRAPAPQSQRLFTLGTFRPRGPWEKLKELV